MRTIIFIFLALIIGSCAKLPVETITITDAIAKEGKRMHQLNILLVEKMFAEKRTKIDYYIIDKYTPAFIENFKANIPPGTNYEEEFVGMINSIVPKVNDKRNKMQDALEVQRIKIINKLNADYSVYESASLELKVLIESAIKVNEQRALAFNQLANITKNKVDFNQLEQVLDEYVNKAGEVGGVIDKNSELLNKTINKLLNK